MEVKRERGNEAAMWAFLTSFSIQYPAEMLISSQSHCSENCPDTGVTSAFHSIYDDTVSSLGVAYFMQQRFFPISP